MATDAPAVRERRPITPEWVLAVLAVLTFALIPIQIGTVYSGLPAHPLFLHVPVILIPVAAVAALVLAARPRLFAGHGLWVGLLTVVALASLNLTMGAGEQLRHSIGPEDQSMIADHAHAADMLRILFILFTAALLVAVAAWRTPGPQVTGLRAVDTGLRVVRTSTAIGVALRAVVAVLAALSLYYVFHTGDLGAKAVWQHRAGGGFSGAGRFPGARGGFPGAGGGPPPGG